MTLCHKCTYRISLFLNFGSDDQGQLSNIEKFENVNLIENGNILNIISPEWLILIFFVGKSNLIMKELYL